MIALKVCDCPDCDYVRLKRPLWAKLFFSDRLLFQCTSSGHKMLVQPKEIEDAIWRQRARHREFVDKIEQRE